MQKAVRSAQAISSLADRWLALKRLARHDLDFASTMRLDRAIVGIRADSDQVDTAAFQPVRLALLSTSTTGHLVAGLRVASLGRGLLLDVHEPDYGQYRQEMADAGSALHAFAPTATLFANDPHALLGMIGDGVTSVEEAEAAVQSVAQSLRRQWQRARDLWGAMVLQQLPFNPFVRLLGENERRLPGAPAALIARLQSAIREAADEEGVDLVDLEYWAARNGLNAWHSAALWNRAKQEVHPNIAPLYGDLVARLLAARFGRSAKCLVLDLDNTVWGGVIGDDGMEGIAIGQGSAVGESYLAFQKYAKRLAARGIILAICSKNDDDVARAPFASHPEMVLRADDISCFVANWTDKATNLRQIARELNIGLDALVFADDNPFERNLIRTEVPDVFVPELGEDAADYAQIVADCGYFEAAVITADDLAKTQQYQANAKRQELLDDVTDLDGYLAALNMTLRHAPFDDVGLSRTVQLINKTNQFNLTTRRYTEPETRALIGNPAAFTRQIRLLDRFGDNGMIAVVIGQLDAERRSLDIESWLMSCRVLGRQVEQATLDVVVEAARAAGLDTITGEYVATERNGMVRDHYARLGFTQTAEASGRTQWTLSLAAYRPTPTHITTEAV